MNTPTNPFESLLLTLNPENYVGYTARVRSILEKASLTPPGSVELLGLPGMGKTSLLRYLASEKAWSDARWRDCLQSPYNSDPGLLLPVLVEFRLLPSNHHPLLFICRRFYEAYAVYRERMSPRFKTQGFVLPAPAPAGLPDDTRHAAEAVERLIGELKNLAIRPVLLLDDFDIALKGMSFEDTTRMRPWRDNVAFVLTTERPFHEVNPDAAGSPFFQTIPLERMGGLTLQEAKQVLEQASAQVGAPLPPADINLVLAENGSHPYLLVQAGKVLWQLREQLNLEPDTPLGEHAPVLQGRLAEEFRRPYHLYLERLTPEERSAIQALRNQAGQPQPAELNGTLAALEGKGIVAYDPGCRGYHLFSPSFDRFVGQLTPSSATAQTGGARRQKLQLSELEENLYRYLQAHLDHTFTLDDIARDVWHTQDHEQAARRIQVTMSRLRAKLQTATGEDIVSVRGQGYRFVPVSGSRGG